MEITAQNLDIFFRQGDVRFQNALNATPVYSDELVDEIPTKTRQINLGWSARLPTMRKWLGPRVVNKIATHSKTITNEPFELTYSILREDLEDDQFGLFAKNLDFLGQQNKKLVDFELADFLLKADDVIGYDGKGLFATDHPVTGGDYTDPSVTGTQSNLDTTTALSYTNYVAARAKMMAYRGEDNRPLGIVPDTLWVPPQLEGIGKLIVEADNLANQAVTIATATTAMTQTNVYKGTAKLRVIPEFARKPTTWYLTCGNKGIKPFVWSRRKAAMFTYLVNPNDPNVFMNREFIYGSEQWGQLSETLWFLIYAGTAGATYQADNS